MIMPIEKPQPNYPEWDPNDKAGLLKIFGTFLHQMAKDVFLEDKGVYLQ
jgi:hypothetical protein